MIRIGDFVRMVDCPEDWEMMGKIGKVCGETKHDNGDEFYTIYWLNGKRKGETVNGYYSWRFKKLDEKEALAWLI